MRNIHSQPDALAALKTRLEALDRAGGRRTGGGVRAESDDAFAPLATGVLHDLYASAPADAVAVNAFGLGMALRAAAGRPIVWGLHEPAAGADTRRADPVGRRRRGPAQSRRGRRAVERLGGGQGLQLDGQPPTGSGGRDGRRAPVPGAGGRLALPQCGRDPLVGGFLRFRTSGRRSARTTVFFGDPAAAARRRGDRNLDHGVGS